MIDIWILTVVVGNVYGLTSYQLKFYSEFDARGELLQHEAHHHEDYCDAFITKTQEQRIN